MVHAFGVSSISLCTQCVDSTTEVVLLISKLHHKLSTNIRLQPLMMTWYLLLWRWLTTVHQFRSSNNVVTFALISRPIPPSRATNTRPLFARPPEQQRTEIDISFGCLAHINSHKPVSNGTLVALFVCPPSPSGPVRVGSNPNWPQPLLVWNNDRLGNLMSIDYQLIIWSVVVEYRIFSRATTTTGLYFNQRRWCAASVCCVLASCFLCRLGQKKPSWASEENVVNDPYDQ